jgi:hypothetical protein
MNIHILIFVAMQHVNAQDDRNVLYKNKWSTKHCVAIVHNITFCLNIFFLLKCYNLYKVLARSTTSFHLSLSCTTFFQLFTFKLLMSPKTSSSQRVLGLPIGRLDMGFHHLIFFTLLSSGIRSTCPNQFSLCFLMNPIMFCPFRISFC